MKYVALLRGINVGGRTKVEMARLKAVFENLGCSGVSTYINSGNVIFSDGRSSKQLAPLIHDAITGEFKLEVPVVLRDQANLELLTKKIPAGWTNDKDQKTDVMFLWDEIDSEDILKKVVIDPKIENVMYLPGALVWNIGRANVAPGGAVKLTQAGLYKQVTIRNVNTVRKLNQLMLHD
jgi:uncharacterized protein (DUF1697 family)